MAPNLMGSAARGDPGVKKPDAIIANPKNVKNLDFIKAPLQDFLDERSIPTANDRNATRCLRLGDAYAPGIRKGNQQRIGFPKKGLINPDDRAKNYRKDGFVKCSRC
jgi:hypothetical protein